MTAEEVALEEFREAVWRFRHARKRRRACGASGNYVHVEKEESRMWRERHFVRALARIIRAIRAERTPFHAMERRLANSIEGGIEAGIELIKARAYEQGRRDALRGVQAAALYRHAELWHGRMRLTSADERRDIDACELAWAAAQAAEEIETQKGAEDDFDAMVRELRALRARVAELEEDRQAGRDRTLGARVREVLEANGTNPERFVSEWCRAQAEYEAEEAAR